MSSLTTIGDDSGNTWAVARSPGWMNSHYSDQRLGDHNAHYLEAFGNPYPMLRALPFHQDFFVWCFSTPLGINLVDAPADTVDVFLGFGAGGDASGRGVVACANYYFDSYSTKLALRGATVSVTINSTTTGVAVTDDMFPDVGGPSSGGVFIGNYPATPPPSFNVNSVTMPT